MLATRVQHRFFAPPKRKVALNCLFKILQLLKEKGKFRYIMISMNKVFLLYVFQIVFIIIT